MRQLLMKTFPPVFFTVLFCFPSSHGRRTNLALSKPTFQISTSWSGLSGRAVDGNKGTRFFVENSCSHTAEAPLTWWMVDLLQEYVISAVEITNRAEEFGRLRDFVVEISTVDPSTLPGFPGMTSSPVCARQGLFVPSTASFYYQCENAVRGRFLRVVKFTDDPLTLCEFEAYGPNSWRLEKAADARGTLDVLETMEGAPAITQCAKWCVQRSGWPCRHILVHRANKTCQLLRRFRHEPSGVNTGWDLYTVVS